MTEEEIAILKKRIQDEVDNLKHLAATTTNPCVVATYIAACDSRVQETLLEKFQQELVFRGTECLSGLPEQQHILVKFDCQPGVFCFINPSFLVVVNIAQRKVETIIDPYTGPTGIDPTMHSIIGPGPCTQPRPTNWPWPHWPPIPTPGPWPGPWPIPGPDTPGICSWTSADGTSHTEFKTRKECATVGGSWRPLVYY